jgi:hypothetical protein
MKKQTAVEWLATYLKGITTLNCDGIIEQAKEMEKQQIINAHIFSELHYGKGIEDGYWHPENGYSNKFESAEQYYNETFKNKQ